MTQTLALFVIALACIGLAVVDEAPEERRESRLRPLLEQVVLMGPGPLSWKRSCAPEPRGGTR